MSWFNFLSAGFVDIVLVTRWVALFIRSRFFRAQLSTEGWKQLTVEKGTNSSKSHNMVQPPLRVSSQQWFIRRELLPKFFSSRNLEKMDTQPIFEFFTLNQSWPNSKCECACLVQYNPLANSSQLINLKCEWILNVFDWLHGHKISPFKIFLYLTFEE